MITKVVIVCMGVCFFSFSFCHEFSYSQARLSMLNTLTSAVCFTSIKAEQMSECIIQGFTGCPIYYTKVSANQRRKQQGKLKKLLYIVCCWQRGRKGKYNFL